MTESDYVQFLKVSLPQLGLRWQGFRKVRRQVIKRLQRRLRELGLQNLSAYTAYIDRYPEEWRVLDACCRITVSRFYRDADVFDILRHHALPSLAQVVRVETQRELRCWSAGCASGEEVYTLKMLWERCLSSQFPELRLRLMATDADPHMLERARRGWYTLGSLKTLPCHWRAWGFDRCRGGYVVRQALREGISFVEQDIRSEHPEGPFHLILCRNLVFTYFAEPVQREVLERLAARLVPGGILVVGKHESLPPFTRQIVAYDEPHGLYQRVHASACSVQFHSGALHEEGLSFATDAYTPHQVSRLFHLPCGVMPALTFFRGHGHEGRQDLFDLGSLTMRTCHLFGIVILRCTVGGARGQRGACKPSTSDAT
jgi:chemotaxis protein methyltransferase CheR